MKKNLGMAGIISATVLFFFFLLAFFFIYRFNLLVDFTTLTEHTYGVINKLEEAESNLKDAETGMRGFMITRDSSFLEPLQRAEKNLPKILDSLGPLVQDNKDQVENFKKLKILSERKMFMLQQAKQFSMLFKLQPDSLLAEMVYEKKIMDDYRNLSIAMKNNELSLLEHRKATVLYYQERLPGNFKLIFSIAAIISFLTGVWLFIEFRRRLSYQASLQQKVLELKESNEELEQIAFAASHDLQEPLRKIRIFSDRLQLIAKDSLGGESLMLTQRINVFAARLQGLIQDLVTFNDLVQNRSEARQLSLNMIIDEVKKNFEDELQHISATVVIETLPEVISSEEQLKILFIQLFSNSIHFAMPGRDLQVNIAATKIEGSSIKGLPKELRDKMFHDVRFSDNGTGFDTAYKEKIFQPFQRLHNFDKETEGRRKGMGLAMCKRVMINTGGWIDAEAEETKGATIHLFFPTD